MIFDFRLMIDDLKIQRTPSGVNGTFREPSGVWG